MRRRAIWAVVGALGCSADDGGEGLPSRSTSSAPMGSGSSSATSPALGEGASSGSAGPVPDSTSSASGDTGTTGEPPSGLPAIGPTMGTLALDFRVALSGTGSLFVGDFQIHDGVGTIEIEDETLPVFVYERQPWPQQGYTLYQALAVSDHDWTVMWFYCTEEGLDSIYLESTDGIPLQTLFAEGTCDVQLSGVEVPMDLPGTEFSVLYSGDPFTIEGPEISVAAGELGEVIIDAVPHVVAPFETVDCSTACGMPGWYEVHALLWDPEALRASFEIIYLEVDGSVRMAYGITLPDLVDLKDEDPFDAEWSFG